MVHGVYRVFSIAHNCGRIICDHCNQCSKYDRYLRELRTTVYTTADFLFTKAANFRVFINADIILIDGSTTTTNCQSCAMRRSRTGNVTVKFSCDIFLVQFAYVCWRVE